MKLVFTFFTLVGTLSVCAQHALSIKVSNIKKIDGAIEICLFDSQENYMKDAIKCIWIEVTKHEVEYRFDSIPSATYAVVIIQDLNGNKDLDTNFIGIPKEPYGFSNNPSTTFGPPDFEGASFSMQADQAIEIKLK